MFVTWDVATAIHGRYQADICDIKHMYVVKCVMFGFKINDKTHYRELYFLIISIPVFLTYTYKSTFWYYWKVAYHNAGDYPILISVISEIAIIYCVLMKSIKYFFSILCSVCSILSVSLAFCFGLMNIIHTLTSYR